MILFNYSTQVSLIVRKILKFRYAGPDSQKISEDFKVDWGTYLASSQGIIYGSIDARGSGRQSTDLKFAVYRNLGSVEVEDQIFVTKYKLIYVHARNILPKIRLFISNPVMSC